MPVVAVDGGSSQTVSFATRLEAGAAYAISVQAQPSAPSQQCVVVGGSGNVVAGNVTSVTVDCSTLYTVAGVVTGLAGQGLVLQNNGADDVALNGNGAFAFATPLPDAAAFAITVKDQPTNKWQTCVATRTGAAPQGTITAVNVTDLTVLCSTNSYLLSVDVSGLDGAGLALGASNETLPILANGLTSFAQRVESGAAFSVAVQTQPSTPTQTCSVQPPAATQVAGADETVAVTCVTDQFFVGGTVSGLVAGGLLLRNNGADDLVIRANANDGPFRFDLKVASGMPHAVTIEAQPAGGIDNECVLVDLAATLSDADITSVQVRCGVRPNGLGGLYAASGANARENAELACENVHGAGNCCSDGCGSCDDRGYHRCGAPNCNGSVYWNFRSESQNMDCQWEDPNEILVSTDGRTWSQ